MTTYRRVVRWNPINQSFDFPLEAKPHKTFETPQPKTAFPLIVLKRACLVVLTAYLLIGFIAAYRAYYQVHRVDLQSEPALKKGAAIKTLVVREVSIEIQ